MLYCSMKLGEKKGKVHYYCQVYTFGCQSCARTWFISGRSETLSGQPRIGFGCKQTQFIVEITYSVTWKRSSSSFFHKAHRLSGQIKLHQERNQANPEIVKRWQYFSFLFHMVILCHFQFDNCLSQPETAETNKVLVF